MFARVRERASHWGAFFVFAGLFFVAVFGARGAVAATAVDCPADAIDEWARVASVTDGDTLRLSDGRSVRFIGVNAPEIGRQGRPSEPLARQARDAVVQMLGGSRARVGLRFDAQRRDRYDRLLAHVYSASGRSLEAGLLSRGLAAQIVVPPNVWNLDCYRNAERAAREAGDGVWGSIYRPLPVASLSKRDTRGFRRITGTVTTVVRRKYSTWVNFPLRAGERRYEGVALRIPERQRHNFPPGFIAALAGKTVIARGWMFLHKNQLVMIVSHPAALEVAENTPAPGIKTVLNTH